MNFMKIWKGNRINIALGINTSPLQIANLHFLQLSTGGFRLGKLKSSAFSYNIVENVSKFQKLQSSSA